MQIVKKWCACYFIHGDEPLLVQETKQQIIETAKTLGFTDREKLIIENSNDWAKLIQLSQNYDLFSTRRVIEILQQSDKWNEKEISTLLDYLDTPSQDIILIVSTVKLSSAQQKTQWFKKLAQLAQVIPLWPVSAAEFPRWLQQRLEKVSFTLEPPALKLLADLTEGNLLAGQQAIEKLRLLYGSGHLTLAQISSALSDNSRYKIFDLGNYALQGDVTRVMRSLIHLREEGEEAILILWTLCRDLRQLITIRDQMQRGISLEQALSKEWQTRKPLLKAAVARHSLKSVMQLLSQAVRIDKIIKGIEIGNVWDELGQLGLRLATK